MLTNVDKQRIERLRTKAVSPVITYEPFYLGFYRAMQGNEALGTMEARYAQAYRCGFEAVTPMIDEDEIIVGKCARELTQDERAQFEALRPYMESFTERRGQNSHMAIDYELVLQEGLSGIAARARKLRAQTEDEEKQRFYDVCATSLDAAADFSDRYAAHAAALAQEESNAQRKAELEEIARVCARVPRYPAQTFHEAVQAVHFITHCLSMEPMYPRSMLQYQLGHPDRYLLPYYEADLAQGRITPERAQLLLDMLAIQINNRVPRGLSSGYMLGGRDRSGQVVANELTVMGMNVIEDIRLVYPSVGLCWTSETPDALLQRACEILAQGRSHPAIFNDDVISQGLIGYGVPAQDAHDYIHSTCVEITPERTSNVWVASPYISLVAPLLQLLDREYHDMDALLKAYFGLLDAKIKAEFEVQNNLRLKRAERNMCPLLSCVVHDCLELGVDIERGGARYNWIMPSFVGMSNLMDSLSVIRRFVFEEKRFTIAQLREMLDANFVGFEAQHRAITNTVPMYGSDDESGDCWCNLITEHIVAECRKYTPVFSNARLVPSVFCWIKHERIGAETGATPDGRRAGFPLGDGSGPAQGREKNGPTASILSSTKWSHKEFIGGVAVNMKFSKKVFSADAYRKMLALIKTYLLRGGFELQINVVDHNTLLAAQRDPEAYRDLVVRIGGYSDYFVRLSKEMQDEVLLRTEHDLA